MLDGFGILVLIEKGPTGEIFYSPTQNVCKYVAGSFGYLWGIAGSDGASAKFAKLISLSRQRGSGRFHRRIHRFFCIINELDGRRQANAASDQTTGSVNFAIGPHIISA